jgi:ATP-dependent RNA helicase RhlE
MIATPGRLLDHLRAPYAKLAALEYLVLDEADRMLDMGFLPDIRRILRHVPQKRQTLFFSATMPPEILKLTGEMLRNPEMIQKARQPAPASGITQAVYPVSQDLKRSLLLHLLKSGQIQQALVFTRTKHRTNRVTEFLVRSGINAERIHGNRSQGQRTAALAGFKSGRYPVLVATDIAARGIDVPNISHVVNYELPNEPESYVHRIGRTARAGAEGAALSFCDHSERPYLQAIERLMRSTVTVGEHRLAIAAPAAPHQPPHRNDVGAPGKRRNRSRSWRSGSVQRPARSPAKGARAYPH